jgi:HEAT repeat protein
MKIRLLEWLSGGDLRSDGAANQVVAFVLANEASIDELASGLDDSDDVVRGRSADALEKIARERPDLIIDRLSDLIRSGLEDPLPVVQMHVAMILGHLAHYAHAADSITDALEEMLVGKRAFARSWAIASLCIVARKYPQRAPAILESISPLMNDPSAAIRTRARKAVHTLSDPDAPFPAVWVKSHVVFGKSVDSGETGR